MADTKIISQQQMKTNTKVHTKTDNQKPYHCSYNIWKKKTLRDPPLYAYRRPDIF